MTKALFSNQSDFKLYLIVPFVFAGITTTGISRHGTSKASICRLIRTGRSLANVIRAQKCPQLDIICIEI